MLKKQISVQNRRLFSLCKYNRKVEVFMLKKYNMLVSAIIQGVKQLTNVTFKAYIYKIQIIYFLQEEVVLTNFEGKCYHWQLKIKNVIKKKQGG